MNNEQHHGVSFCFFVIVAKLQSALTADGRCRSTCTFVSLSGF
jgi:hypothetical protein